MKESFKAINYTDLTSVQKESYAFCQIQAVMSRRGWLEFHRLNDDHNGADWVAFHKDGKTERFQQKARFVLDPKYYGSGLKVVVYDFTQDSVYVYDHDENFDIWSEGREEKEFKNNFLRSRTLPEFAKVKAL